MFQKSANLPVIVNVLVDMYTKQVAPTEKDFKKDFDTALLEYTRARNATSRKIMKARFGR